MRLLASILSLFLITCALDDGFVFEIADREDLKVALYTATIQNGLSDPVDIEVPEGTESLLIEVEGSSGKYFLTKLVNPQGRDLVEAGQLVTRAAREVPGLVDWMFPNDPGIEVDDGIYQLTVRAEAPGGGNVASEEVRVRVYFKTDEAMRGCGVKIDFLVDDDAIAVSDLDKAIEQVVASLLPLYQAIDMTVIDYQVQRIDLQSPDIDFSGETSVLPVVDDVLAQARRNGGARSDAVHVLLVRNIGGTQEPAGYSMGLPGPYQADLPTSAVIVATDPFVGSGSLLDVERMTITVAHEIGHFLGLYHTSERGGGIHDPISDTPECDNALCDQEFDSNIMTSGSLTRDKFTPGQGQVMRRHPLCRPSATDNPPLSCDLSCDAPEVCAFWEGVQYCLPVCDPDMDECDGATFCAASDTGLFVCSPPAGGGPD